MGHHWISSLPWRVNGGPRMPIPASTTPWTNDGLKLVQRVWRVTPKIIGRRPNAIFKVGPSSTEQAHHWSSIGSTTDVCWAPHNVHVSLPALICLLWDMTYTSYLGHIANLVSEGATHHQWVTCTISCTYNYHYYGQKDSVFFFPVAICAHWIVADSPQKN